MVWEKKEKTAGKEACKSLVKSIQGSVEFDNDAAEFLGQFIAWYKLSETAGVDQQALYKGWLNSTDIKQGLKHSWESLSGMASSDYARCTFKWNEELAGKLDEGVLRSLWFSLQSASEKGVLVFNDVFFNLVELIQEDLEDQWLPYEVAMFMLHLVDPEKNESIYCPFNSSLSVAALAGRFFKNVFSESSEDTTWPCIINILENSNIQHRKSDPVESPGWVEKGSLREFDYTLASPPMGKKYRDVDDWFQRFPDGKFFRGEIYQLHHILAQTREKAVVIVADSFLQRTAKAETEFRKYILEKNWLDVVVRLGRHSKDFSDVPMSLLVFNKKRTREDVALIDAEHARYSEGEIAYLSSLENNSIIGEEALGANFSLREVVQFYRYFCSDDNYMAPSSFEAPGTRHEKDPTYQGATSLTLAKFKEEKYNLDVRRYVLSTGEDNVYMDLGDEDIADLGRLASLIRPRSVRRTDGQEEGTEYREAALIDIPDAGYVKQPEKKVYVKSENLTPAEKQKLKPNDILLSIKGTIGEVGIVPHNTDGDWLANQSFQIIRLSEKKKPIDPRVLYSYLKSDMAQFLLKKRIYRATVPMVQKKDLESFPIPVLSKEEQQEIIKSFEEEVRLKAEIEKIEEKIRNLKRKSWNPDYLSNE